MMKSEFIEKVQAAYAEMGMCDRVADFSWESLSGDDYAMIEKVYMYHPAIPNVGGKQAIARLYAVGGMAVIRDMERTAAREQEREAMRCRILDQIAELQAQLAAL